jgi:hypothetical protein
MSSRPPLHLVTMATMQPNWDRPLTELCFQADDELENPVLAGFEWDPEESWTRLVVHCKKEGAPQPKKKSKKGQEGTGGDDI